LLGLGRRAEFESNLTQIQRRAEVTGNSLLGVLTHAGAAILALVDGRFDDVVPAAEQMLAAAPDEENTQLSYFTLVGRVALEQGRAADMAEGLEATAAISPDLVAVQAVLALARVEVGDAAGAAEVVDRVFGRWDDWARDWSWSITLSSMSEAVTALEARANAAVMVAELEPYAGELGVLGAGIACLGAYDRYRGMLLGVLGRDGEAVDALEAALLLEESIQSPTFTARTRYWLALALRRRGGPGDDERAEASLRRSIADAEALGMASLARAGRRQG
jgi:hypothetical protein